MPSALGLKTPIASFMHLKSRKILTINHVVEILLHYLKSKDWNESFHQIIPQRKME